MGHSQVFGERTDVLKTNHMPRRAAVNGPADPPTACAEAGLLNA